MGKLIKLSGCLLMLLLARPAFGCSIVTTPITQFDPGEYIFTGEVVGFVGPAESKSVAGQAWGLLVKADESVHLPRRPSGSFEVFPYDLESDCSLFGRTQERLSRDHPLGSKVVVIANESKDEVAGQGNVRLSITPWGNGLLSTIGARDGQFSAVSFYDYRAHTGARTVLPLFELRKDLLRLRHASSEGEKVEVLRRLAYFPQEYSIDYESIVRQHLKEKATATQLIAEREAWKRRPSSP